MSDEEHKPEQNTDLDAVEREALALEGAATAAAQPAPPVATNTAAELLGGLEMLRLMASPAFADWAAFEKVWSDATLRGIADNGGAIMDRHGWTVGEFMGKWGPYIGLVGAVAPAGLATYQHLQMRKAQAEREARGGAGHERPQQAAN